MAEFLVEFERNTNPGPEYDDYGIDQATQCNDDAQQRRVRFNDTVNGDLVVGYNYHSSAGYAAQSIRIMSYTDDMVQTEISSGTSTTPVGFIPSRLKRNSTNTILTYPYDMNISELSDIGMELNSLEIICPGSADKYQVVRTRVIEYVIFDSDGQPGPVRNTKYTNSKA